MVSATQRNPMASYPVSDLRKCYNRGRANGSVNISGLTYGGKVIASLNFRPAMVLDYIDENGKLFASFQDCAVLDD